MARVPGPPRTLNSRNNLANAYPEAVRIPTGKLSGTYCPTGEGKFFRERLPTMLNTSDLDQVRRGIRQVW